MILVLEWTHLRPTGFAKNTLISADEIRAGDVVRWPYPEAARSLIDERDIAAVAVQALVRDELVGAMPVISGPEVITQADQIFARTALDVWAGFVTEPEVVTTAVAEITGEPARPFRDWAAESADGGEIGETGPGLR